MICTETPMRRIEKKTARGVASPLKNQEGLGGRCTYFEYAHLLASPVLARAQVGR